MPRAITEEACKAFESGYEFEKSNTVVGWGYDPSGRPPGWYLWLHDNAIAKSVDGKLFVRSAGRRTLTTKERLNGLSGVSVYQKNNHWHLNGEPWENDSEWTEVS